MKKHEADLKSYIRKFKKKDDIWSLETIEKEKHQLDWNFNKISTKEDNYWKRRSNENDITKNKHKAQHSKST